MPENQTQPLPQKAAKGATKLSTGLKLLSPTLQQSTQNLTSNMSSPYSADNCGWSTSPPTSDTPLGVNAEDCEEGNRNSVEFDFDGFTLASVRGRKEKVHQDATRTSAGPNFRGSRANNTDRAQQPRGGTADCAFYYDDNSSVNLLSCSMSSVITTTSTENFAMSQRQREHSFNKEIQQASIVSRPTAEDASRGRYQMSSTAASAGFPMAKKKELTAVVMRGWLQKRKGRVLKRWKPYYCLWKSDDSLCLYASEDTVNGRLEQRYQVLRVVLTDKNDSFHIIGVDSESAPRREEFRVLVSTEWICWFQVLGKFFDKSSMVQARLRKPALVFAKLVNETEENNWPGYSCDIDPGTSAVLSKHMNYQSYDGCCSYSSQRKQSAATVCDSLDGSGYDKMSTPSSFSGSSASSINVKSQADQETTASQVKRGLKLYDCPMIECKSQRTVPTLEVRASGLN